MTVEIVLATRNAHKVGELRAILTGPDGALPGLDPAAVVGADAYPQVPDVVEDGVTFAENALLKARALAAATGLVAVADDSGLAVDVLGGAPGIFSARWAGRHGDDYANLDLLLAQLGDVPDEHRRAAFVCAAALVTPDGRTHAAGDSAHPFSIQSAVKPFLFALALADTDGAALDAVGIEPTGESFDAIKLESGTGRPPNPMVNAGAILTASLVR